MESLCAAILLQTIYDISLLRDSAANDININSININNIEINTFLQSEWFETCKNIAGIDNVTPADIWGAGYEFERRGTIPQ